ncbi:hypothetical protein F5Y11DRAFT_324362 [Daldinia sp. FL1419]|nr:hypothetical protein F5Y11DRAFT_324362 [Daldinia sp. FL1419]
MPVTISPKAETLAPGKPKGAVPILTLPDGSFIKQSVAILDYFEDICDNPQEDWQKDMAAAAKACMRGNNVCKRATARESIALADEAASMSGFACHKGSKLFLERETTNPAAPRMAIDLVRRNMKRLEPITKVGLEEITLTRKRSL